VATWVKRKVGGVNRGLTSLFFPVQIDAIDEALLGFRWH